MTALSIEEELVRLTAEKMWAARGTVVQGVVLQTMPDYDPKIGELAYGAAAYPFWSVTTVVAERIVENASFGDLCRTVRTVTAVLVAHRIEAESMPYRWRLAQMRQAAIRSVNKKRLTGHYASDPNSFLHYGIVRPRSIVEASSWFQRNCFVCAMDVEFTSDESPS